MDSSLIQLVARLKIHLRHDKGVSVNTQRFFAEAQYAREIVDLAEESDEIELVSMALELREKLGWIAPAPVFIAPVAAVIQPPAPPEQRTTPARYAFGARS